VLHGDFDGGEAHLGADEVLELFPVDFAEALEAGDFGPAQGGNGGIALGLGVAVAGFLLVAHAEEGGFEDVEVAGQHDRLEEAQEKGSSRLRMCRPSTSASVAMMIFWKRRPARESSMLSARMRL
jgi:hypothetical protein